MISINHINSEENFLGTQNQTLLSNELSIFTTEDVHSTEDAVTEKADSQYECERDDDLHEGCESRHKQLKKLEKIQSKTNRSPWQPEEDEKLRSLIKIHGKKWSYLSKLMGGKRTGKQIRDRWVNKLDSSILEKPWTSEEDELLLKLWKIHGNRWSEIARHYEGRTESMIKNRYYSNLNRRKVTLGATISNNNMMTFPNYQVNPANSQYCNPLNQLRGFNTHPIMQPARTAQNMNLLDNVVNYMNLSKLIELRNQNNFHLLAPQQKNAFDQVYNAINLASLNKSFMNQANYHNHQQANFDYQNMGQFNSTSSDFSSRRNSDSMSQEMKIESHFDVKLELGFSVKSESNQLEFNET